MKNDTIWTTSKFNREELDKQTIEFAMRRGDVIIEGVAEIWVRENPDGLLAVDIVTDVQGKHWAERIQTRYHLPQVYVDRIAKHPDPSIARYQLL